MPKSKRKKKPLKSRLKLLKRFKFTRLQYGLAALLLSAIGAYLVFQSRAGTTFSLEQFPLRTTQSVVKAGYGGGIWCYDNTTSCHHGGDDAADIHAPPGTPVQAAQGGRVSYIRNVSCSTKSSGGIVSISSQGYNYHYLHMDPASIAVSNGEVVPAGKIIGKVGPNSCAVGTQAHLHFEVSRCSIDQCAAIDSQGSLKSAFYKIGDWSDATTDLPGDLALDIGAGGRGIFAIGGNRELYRWDGDDEDGDGNSNWERSNTIGGSGGLAVDVGRSSVWVVSVAGNVYQSSGSGWVRKYNGKAIDIGIGPTGKTWIVRSDGQELLYTGGSFKDQAGGGSAARIDVGSAYPWKIVKSTGNIYRRTTSWKPITGLTLAGGDISIGGNGSIWGIKSSGFYRYTGKWSSLGTGGGTDLTVDENGIPWKIKDGRVYYYRSPY